MSAIWQSAFVAVSALLGEPLDAVERALGPGADSAAEELIRRLGQESRATRARALAVIVSQVALAIEERNLA